MGMRLVSSPFVASVSTQQMPANDKLQKPVHSHSKHTRPLQDSRVLTHVQCTLKSYKKCVSLCRMPNHKVKDDC